MFGLVPDAARQATADRLAELVRAAGTTVGTGFLSTGMLLPGARRERPPRPRLRTAPAARSPGWMYMIDNGATTMWERWNGVDDDGVAPRVAQPLQQGRGDLVPPPLHGRARPDVPWLPHVRRPAAARRWARPAWPSDSSTGRGRSISSGAPTTQRFELTVDVPERCSAEIELPNGQRTRVGAGRHVLGG